MRRLILSFALALSFFFLTPYSRAGDLKPVGSIGLPALGYKPGDGAVVRFHGPYLMIAFERTRAVHVFDQETRQLIPAERLSGVVLPSPWTSNKREGNVVSRWKQMFIEMIVTQSATGPDDEKYFLREPGKEPVLLFHGRCPAGLPEFVGDDRILIHLCNGKNVVVNKKGEQVYALPKLSDAYVIPNHNGTRFVTYERIASFLCLVCETEKLRVKVFRSADGKKLFEYQWRLSDAPDSISPGRVALSDDGALVALIRGEEVLVFAIVTGK